jgi:hypothetical protein
MAKVRMKAGKEAFEKAGQDQGDFVLPKVGYYTGILKSCSDGYSKDNDGNEDKNRPRLECVYEITGIGKTDEPVTENYGNVWDYVSFSEESEWKRAEFMKAIGLAEDAADLEFDTDEVEGTKVLMRLKHEKGRTKEDSPRAKVAKLLPWSDEDAEAAFGDGGETEDVAYTDEPPEGEYLTEEALLGMDVKELGKLAGEFDIDPQTLVVRNRAKKVDLDKTKAAVIAAILEAQGAPEDEGSDVADDDPF